MTLTIHPTDQLVTLNGRVTRHWRGITERGVPCDIFVALIRVRAEENAEFENELLELPEPAGDPIDIMRLP